MPDGRRRRVLVLSGWSPGPLDVLRSRCPDVDFLEPSIPMPPAGCRWCLNPFCLLLLVVLFWLTPEAASNEDLVAEVDGSFAWLVRLALLLAVPVLLRLVVAGLVWFAIKDGVWTTSRAIRDFQPDVLLAFSWGGGVALWLLGERRWKGPTILLAPTVNAMSWVSCCAVPRLLSPQPSAPIHVFHAENDGFCPASQVATLSAAGCDMHICDDSHVLLRRSTVEEIHSCLKLLLALPSPSSSDSQMLGANDCWD
mmetsp:Transcript_30631/g.68829  ORF Transcript_30631/g.68829 Transcript_30631/m.68829 type:complete len:253 (+) Transcript_30631:55-813(+)